ncbi:cytochrome b [Curvibacter sp. CHRR-16]|uniref:cytochrome b n=1 Tax=Curvibacter sp. CHRR-16 TaxID=2835872 RepID=UPI001BDB1742|nr:cytochrome b [Curvibacter sp. CHRR-16]
MSTPAPAHYDLFTRLTHWLTAGVIITAITIGLFFNVMGETAFQFFGTLNKSLGTAILPLIVLRYVWRWLRPQPAYPASMSALNRWVARIHHELFYLLIFAVELSGLFMIKSGFFVFWLIYVPAPIKDLEWNYRFATVHTWGIALLCAMLALHLAAVAWHWRQGRREVLYRMLPQR